MIWQSQLTARGLPHRAGNGSVVVLTNPATASSGTYNVISTQAGGSGSHTHPISIPDGMEVVPPYYALAFVMYLGENYHVKENGNG